MPDHAVEIAVLKEQLSGIREQQRTQADKTEKLFIKLFEEIDVLKAALNRGKGVYTASLMFAGAIGGAATLIVEWFAWKR